MHLRLGPSSGFFLSDPPTKTLYALLLSPISATCPVHLILLDVIPRINLVSSLDHVITSCTSSSSSKLFPSEMFLYVKKQVEIAGREGQTVRRMVQYIPRSHFALRNRKTERTSHLAGLWIGAAISNTSHSNKARSTTAKRARLTGRGSRSTAVLP